MKSKIMLIIVLVLLMFVLVPIAGFALKEMKFAEDAVIAPTTETVYGKRFDFKCEPDRKELPNRNDAQQVVEGMSISEVCSILGNPQRDIGSGTVVFEWKLNSGEELVVSFGLSLELDDWIVIQASIG